MIFQGYGLNEKSERVGIALTRYQLHENGVVRYRILIREKDGATLTIGFIAYSDVLAALKMTKYLNRQGIRLAL